MSGHRQAAAALFGLARSDQDAILNGLAARDEAILRGYLAELSELGFDKAANMAAVAEAGQAYDTATVQPAARPPSASASPVAPDPRERLRRANPAEVFAVVAQEPAALIAQLLSIEAWPWAEAMLCMLPSARSTQVQIAIDVGVRAAPACERFLVDALSARLDDRLAGQSGARLGRLPRTMRKWLPWTR